MQNPSPETREKLSLALGVPPWAWQGMARFGLTTMAAERRLREWVG